MPAAPPWAPTAILACKVLKVLLFSPSDKSVVLLDLAKDRSTLTLELNHVLFFFVKQSVFLGQGLKP